MRLVLGVFFACLLAVAAVDAYATDYTVNIDGTTYAVGVTGGLVYGNQNVYNVTSAAYGAVGDGVTDDSSAIQAAFNAAMAGGVANSGTVYIPAGRYGIGTKLNVGHDPGINIIGDRAGGTWFEALAGLDTAFLDIGITNSGYGGSAGKTNEIEVSGIKFNNENAPTLDAFIRIGDGRSVYVHDIDFRDGNDGKYSGGATHGILIDPSLAANIGVTFSTFARISDSGAGACDSSMIYAKYINNSSIHDIRVSKNATWGVMLGGGAGSSRANAIYNIHAEPSVATQTAMVYINHSSGTTGSVSHTVIFNLHGTFLADYGVYMVAHASRHIWGNIFIIDESAFELGATNIIDNGSTVYRNLYNGLSYNAGNPNSAGIWAASGGYGSEGDRVYDTTDGGFYQYANGSWRRLTGAEALSATADDVTPTVLGAAVLSLVENTGATAITQLDDGVTGQRVTLLGTSATNSATISDGGNFVLKAASWTAGVDSVLTLITTNGTTWREISR